MPAPVSLPLDRAIQMVTPFCGGPDDAEYKRAPFGSKVAGNWYCAATDGHRAALVLCPEAEGLIVPGAPLLDQVVPRQAQRVGSIIVNLLDGARELPGSWCSILEYSDGCAWLNCSRRRGSKKKERNITIINRAKVDWLSHMEFSKPTGISVPYLLDAIDFRYPLFAEVDVYQEPGDALNPWVLACGAYLDATVFTVTMPVRL